MVGTSVTRLIPADRQAEESESLDKVKRGEVVDHLETQWRTMDGRLIDVSATISAIKDATGGVVGVSKVARDITQRKQAWRESNELLEARVREGRAELASSHAALQEGEARMGGIVSSAMDAIISVDAAQRIVLFNVAAEKMFRCAATEALGGTLDRFLAPGSREKHPQHVEDFGKTGGTSRSMHSLGELSGLRADGEEFPIEASTSQLELAGQKIYTVILRDITERKRAEEASSLLAAIVDSSFDAIVGKDLHSIVTSWNAGAERMFGYSADEMIGHSITRLLPPERQDDEEHILAQIRRGETVQHFETVRVKKDAGKIDVSVTVSPIKNTTGAIIGASKVARDITYRKRAEETLRESEEQFRTMANSIPQLAWMARADGFIFWYNQRWHDYTGTTPEQMDGWGWQSVHDPALLPTVLEKWREAIATGRPFEMEFPLRGADGRFRRFLTRVQPSRDAQGNVVQWFGTNTDVDELKRMEESLRDTQARLNSTLAAGSIGTWTWDIVNDRLAADEFTARMFSVEANAAAKGMPAEVYLQVVKEEDRLGVADALERAIHSRGKYDIEYRVRQKEGTLLWLQARGRVECDPSGHASYFHGAVIDITERKEAEEMIQRLNADLEQRVIERTAQLEAANTELRDSRAELNSLFESLPGLYLVLTPDLEIVAASDAYLKATMTTREGIIGRALFDVFPDNPNDTGASAVSNMRASMARVLRTTSSDTMAIQRHDIRRPDGVFEERYWSPVNSPVFGADRKIRYIAHRVEEVTDFVRRKASPLGSTDELNARVQQMEAEIFKSSQSLQATIQQLESANKELEAFSYSVSHDLRAPLRAVNGFAAILLEEFGPHLPAEARRYLERINNGGKRMGELIDDLLAFSRLGRQPLGRRPMSMARMVQDALDELIPQREGRKIDIRIGALPDCLGDPALVRQVWVNLLSNAIKYTRGRAVAEIEIGSTSWTGEDVYFVRDNGTGFDMKYADKLFGVFQRMHRTDEFEGTGVGLAIVHRIVQRHGGRVWAEAEQDRGATFHFTLGKDKP
jgi:PAS domain S-box-containing protein